MESFSSATSSCRACLQGLTAKSRRKSVKLSEFVSIIGVTYLQAFEICSGFLVKPLEPQEICGKCASELLIAFQFKERCKETQNELEQALGWEITDDSLQMMKIEDVDIKIEDTFLDFEEAAPLLKCEAIPLEEEEEAPEQISEDDNKEGESSEPIETKIKCFYCEKRFCRLPNVIHHCNIKHKSELTEPCPYCQEKQFPPHLANHMKRCPKRGKKEKTRDEKSLCPICGVLKPQYHIKWHLDKDYIAPKPFICDICGSKLFTRTGIATHMKTKHMKIFIDCSHCSEKFRTRQQLDTHLRKIHPEVKGLVKCKLCDFTTLYDANLRHHQKNHAAKKLYKCHVCHREFNHNKTLKNHMATHSDERPFACDICGATCKTRKSLSAHKKIHQAHNYECPVCQRTFLTNQLMTQHVKKIHPGYQLPPPGTIMNKSYRKKVAEQKLKEEALRKGVDKKVVDAIKVTEAPSIEELEVFQPYDTSNASRMWDKDDF